MVNQEIQELRKVVQVSDLLKLNRKIENIYYMGEGVYLIMSTYDHMQCSNDTIFGSQGAVSTQGHDTGFCFHFTAFIEEIFNFLCIVILFIN